MSQLLNQSIVKPPTIFLVGEVSSGKSSFLNALVGGYVANASLQRETLRPNYYEFFSDAGSALLNKKKGADYAVQKIACSLENNHKQNENDRANLNKLNDEDISNLNIICEGNDKLPLGFGLGEFNIIDFPGINDAEDKDDKFIKVIEHHIIKADLLIYVTDANSAFQRESEVKSFGKLKAMVQKELDDGHYVDIIVVVNKFDDLGCPDLTDIYKRLPKHTGLPQDKILRFSSHKMLITNMKQNKKTLYVPDFSRRELRRILKTANVIVTSDLKKKLESSGKVYYEDIQYEEELDTCDGSSSSNNTSTNTEGSYDGDWDKFIGYLGAFNAHLPKNSEDTMITRLRQWRLKCTAAISVASQNNANHYFLGTGSSQHNDSKCNILAQKCTSIYVPLFDELQMLIAKNIGDKYSFNIFSDAIVKMINDVFALITKECTFAFTANDISTGYQKYKYKY